MILPLLSSTTETSLKFEWDMGITPILFLSCYSKKASFIHSFIKGALFAQTKKANFTSLSLETAAR